MIAIGTLACLPVFLAACGSSSSDSNSSDTSGSPTKGGTVTIASAIEPESLDPQRGGDPGSANVDAQIYDQLVEVTSKEGSRQAELKPGLAESWDLSKDGLTYTFHLRKAQFSNGEPVTSDDVVFTLKRAMDPKSAPVAAPLYTAFIKSVTNPDPATVVMKLKHPTPAALDFLAITAGCIIPKNYFLKVGAAGFAEKPIGSGPFQLDHWQGGSELVMVRNPHYWQKGLPYVDKVAIRYIPDANARILALNSGAIDVDDDVPYSQQSAVEGQSEVDVVKSPIAATFAVVLNVNGNPALKDQAVRQALNYATPKEAINKVVFNNEATIANSIIPPLKHWDENVPPYPYDTAKAKQLLASAGQSDLSLSVDVLSGDVAAIQTATILQEAWSEVGVKLDVKQAPAAAMGHDFISGQGDGQIWNPTQWASDLGVEDQWGGLVSEIFPSLTGYENAQLNALIKEATTTTDEQKRQALWVEIQELMLEDAPWVPIVYPQIASGVRSDVSGFGYLPTARWKPLEAVSVG